MLLSNRTLFQHKMSLKGRSCWGVNIRMVAPEKLSLEAIGRFVAASEEIRFEAADRQPLYGWVEQVLVGRQYAQLGKAARGLVRRYIEKMTGRSRAQVTRLIALYTASRRVEATVYRRRQFPQCYIFQILKRQTATAGFVAYAGIISAALGLWMWLSRDTMWQDKTLARTVGTARDSCA